MESMRQVLEALSDWVHDNWIKILTGLALMAAGWLLGRWRARGEWKRREFYGRLNISLNQFHGGKLLIRTIVEKTCQEILLNAAAVDVAQKAARKTTLQDPILPLPKEDYWFYLNGVLNEISEKFAVGLLKRDMGVPVTAETYLVCLTSEAAGAVRTRKIRAMLVRKQSLLNLPNDAPQFESPNHAVRWETLKILAGEFRKNPHRFLEMEICL